MTVLRRYKRAEPFKQENILFECVGVGDANVPDQTTWSELWDQVAKGPTPKIATETKQTKTTPRTHI